MELTVTMTIQANHTKLRMSHVTVRQKNLRLRFRPEFWSSFNNLVKLNTL